MMLEKKNDYQLTVELLRMIDNTSPQQQKVLKEAYKTTDGKRQRIIELIKFLKKGGVL